VLLPILGFITLLFSFFPPVIPFAAPTSFNNKVFFSVRFPSGFCLDGTLVFFVCPCFFSGLALVFFFSRFPPPQELGIFSDFSLSRSTKVFPPHPLSSLIGQLTFALL